MWAPSEAVLLGLRLLPELGALDPPPAVALVSGALTSELAARAFKEGAIPMARPDDPETLRELMELLAHLRLRSLNRGLSPDAPKPSESPTDPRRAPLAFEPFVLHGYALTTPNGPRRLRHLEAGILACLARRNPASVTVVELAKIVLGRGDDGMRRSVYSHVTNLRLNLGPYAALVATERGVGYLVRARLDAPESSPSRSSPGFAKTGCARRWTHPRRPAADREVAERHTWHTISVSKEVQIRGFDGSPS